MTMRDWFPVITLLLGSTLTIIGGLLSERYRSKTSLAQVRQERELQQKLVHATFQRDTILQLQDAGQDLIRFTIQCFKEKWPKDPQPTADPDQRRPQPVSEEAELARSTTRIQVDKLISRLEYEQDRMHVSMLMGLSREVMDSDDFEVAHTKLLEMQYRLSEANETILGPILRQSFGP
jgi:hypothetical protein